MRIAVIGAGIAGLFAAWRLSREHDVTVFEAGNYPGGHTNTIDVDWQGKHYAVDTGFIVFNDWTYPSFIAMLRELGVAWQPSNMSFSLRCERTGLEYNGTSLNSLFAQRSNIASPSFLRMIYDILRFNRESRGLLKSSDGKLALGEYLRLNGYSKSFAERYILPMGRAIWSAEADAMLSFPARFFVDFFDRHGFLDIENRPRWQAVHGGSREYVRKLISSMRADVRLSTPIESVRRRPNGVEVCTQSGEVHRFDNVFMACHSDQALDILGDASAAEREVLSAFPYTANEAILHTDTSLLPKRPLARAAWNYHSLANPQQPVALTYDMNILQTIDAPTKFLVTLNHADAIDKSKIIQRIAYHHPVYLPAGVAAQARHREVNGARRTYFCGAYWGYGFHEDGVVSALRALEHFQWDLTSRGEPTSMPLQLASGQR